MHQALAIAERYDTNISSAAEDQALYPDLVEAPATISLARILRVWRLAEAIAREPGRNRGELAFRRNLSERQLQADLNMIRHEFGLPLVRRSGYRYEDGGGPNGLKQTDVVLLALVVVDVSTDRRAALLAALPGLVPSYLKSSLLRCLDVLACTINGARLLEALLDRSFIRLHYAEKTLALLSDPVVCPEILLPYNGKWYVLGTSRQHGKSVVCPLDGLLAVSFAG